MDTCCHSHKCEYVYSGNMVIETHAMPVGGNLRHCESFQSSSQARLGDLDHCQHLADDEELFQLFDRSSRGFER